MSAIEQPPSAQRWTLRMHRINAGLTQAELAERADRATSTVVEIERGQSTPTPGTMKAISGVLGVGVLDVEEFYQTAVGGTPTHQPDDLEPP